MPIRMIAGGARRIDGERVADIAERVVGGRIGQRAGEGVEEEAVDSGIGRAQRLFERLNEIAVFGRIAGTSAARLEVSPSRSAA